MVSVAILRNAPTRLATSILLLNLENGPGLTVFALPARTHRRCNPTSPRLPPAHFQGGYRGGGYHGGYRGGVYFNYRPYYGAYGPYYGPAYYPPPPAYYYPPPVYAAPAPAAAVGVYTPGFSFFYGR